MGETGENYRALRCWGVIFGNVEAD